MSDSSPFTFPKDFPEELLSWGRPLNPAESMLQQQLAIYVRMQAMFYAYFAQRGVLFKAAALPADIPKGMAKRCFQNAAELSFENPELTYVEGLAHGVLLAHHAWCVTPDGVVVDPTWKSPEHCAYLGIPFNVDFLHMRILETGHWGVFDEMPSRELLRTPLEEMFHPAWLAEVSNRPQWDRLHELLNS